MRADVVVVGAGPAGASAALWARSLRLVPEVLESTGAAGGQLKLIETRLLDLVGVMGAEGRGRGCRAWRRRSARALRPRPRCARCCARTDRHGPRHARTARAAPFRPIDA